MSGYRAESAVDRHRWLNLLWCPGTHKAVACSEASYIWSTAKPKGGLKFNQSGWEPVAAFSCWLSGSMPIHAPGNSVGVLPLTRASSNQLKGDLIRDCQPLGRLNHQCYKEKLFIRILEKKKKSKTKESCSSSSFLYTRTRDCKWGLNVVIYPRVF